MTRLRAKGVIFYLTPFSSRMPRTEFPFSSARETIDDSTNSITGANHMKETYWQHRIMEPVFNRRAFLNRLALVSGGVITAGSLLPILSGQKAEGAVVPADHPQLTSETIQYPSDSVAIRAYLVRPQTPAKRPGIIVIHENRGLNAHIEDVARRIALEGYLAIAPDALSPLGGTPTDPEAAPNLIRQLDPVATVNHYLAAIRFLKSHPQSNGKVGCMGFCWGGALANQLAVKAPDLIAAVPYYGMQPNLEEVPRIRAALLLHYAGVDDRINRGMEAYAAALKQAGVDFRQFIYPGAQHAFNNDTNPSRYHPEAAKLAWQRTVDFLAEKLKP